MKAKFSSDDDMDPHTPFCCGSNVLFPWVTVTKAGNFSWKAAVGGFQVKNDIDLDTDTFSSVQVTDLYDASVSQEANLLTLRFTAPGIVVELYFNDNIDC